MSVVTVRVLLAFGLIPFQVQSSVYLLSFHPLSQIFFFMIPLMDCSSKSLGRKHPGVGLHVISLSRTDTHAQTRGDTRVPAAHRAESRRTRAIPATQAERGGAKLGLFWPWGLSDRTMSSAPAKGA